MRREIIVRIVRDADYMAREVGIFLWQHCEKYNGFKDLNAIGK